MLRRDAWYEWSEDGYVVAIDRWTNDRETLVTALFDTGWFETTGAAMRAASEAEFKHIWAYFSDETEMRAPSTDYFSGAEQVTLVDVGEFLDG